MFWGYKDAHYSGGSKMDSVEALVALFLLLVLGNIGLYPRLRFYCKMSKKSILKSFIIQTTVLIVGFYLLEFAHRMNWLEVFK